jgi:hypothetical protein
MTKNAKIALEEAAHANLESRDRILYVTYLNLACIDVTM